MSAGLLEELAALVECESPSADTSATALCGKVLDDIADSRLGRRATWHEVDGRSHLGWRFGGEPRVLLLGHLDTVWPMGTLARWPYTVDGDQVSGPGVFDMKAGLVQLFAALSSLDDLDGVSVLVTSDEEIGSPTSRDLVEDYAAGCDAVLVLEPSLDGALKTARKGVGLFVLEVTGRSAHAGLEPELGINATLEAAQQAVAVYRLSQPDRGTTVTPTVLNAGTTVNTVPARATLAVDVRAESTAELERVAAELRDREPFVPGATVATTVQSLRPPLESAMSAGLFACARRLAHELGIGRLDGVRVGGGSDGNFTAALGVPTLDGLGAVGGGAHAEGEWASLPHMSERAALVAAIVTDVLTRESGA